MAMGPTNRWRKCALTNGDPRVPASQGGRSARSDRYRGWLRSNFVARERREADHRPHHAKHSGMLDHGSHDTDAA
jgi:hypothetical protein